MKKLNFSIKQIILYTAAALLLLLFFLNYIFMPWYVSGDEVVVPRVIGMNSAQAEEILNDADLDPINGGEKYNENYPKGTVIFQNPVPGAKVKDGRRVFIFVSSGIPLIKVPSLKGKVFRDAKMTLERMDLTMGDTTYVESDAPKFTIIDQQYYAGTEVKKGTRVNVTISAGKVVGIKVPDLSGKSLAEAETILSENGLALGRINYQPSFSLLPNTVIDQYPSKDMLVPEGAKVDLFVTKNVETPEEGKQAEEETQPKTN